MSDLPVITLAPACPFSNTREIHLLACYKAAYRTRHQHMHNRRCTHRDSGGLGDPDIFTGNMEVTHDFKLLMEG